MLQFHLKYVTLLRTIAEGNKTNIDAIFNGAIVSSAIFDTFKDAIQLEWVETRDKFRSKGLASLVLDFLCDKALQNGLNLEIKAVDEENLEESFYAKWFHKRTDPHNNYPEEVKDKFNSLIDQRHHRVVLTADDLSWKPGLNTLRM